jgi:hypothetical protein
MDETIVSFAMDVDTLRTHNRACFNEREIIVKTSVGTASVNHNVMHSGPSCMLVHTVWLHWVHNAPAMQPQSFK